MEDALRGKRFTEEKLTKRKETLLMKKIVEPFTSDDQIQQLASKFLENPHQFFEENTCEKQLEIEEEIINRKRD